MRNQKRVIKWILSLAQAVALICLVFLIVDRESQVINSSIRDWGSNYVDFTDGWYVDESLMDTDDTIDIICGPYIKLKRGSYTVKIEYECDYDQSCLAYANSGKDKYIKTELRKLRHNQEYVSYGIVLTKDIDNFEVVVKYDGRGALRIDNIEIAPDTTGLQRKLVYLFCFFIALDLFWYFSKKWEKFRLLLLAEGGVLLFLASIIVLRGGEFCEMDVNMEDWESEYTEFDEGWYVDESVIETNNSIDMIYGPYIKLECGTYTVKIDYECENNQTARVYSNFGNNSYIRSGIIRLSKNQKSVFYDFTLTEGIEDLEILIKYNGKGFLKVNNIEIIPNTIGYIKIFTVMFFLFLFLDLCLFFRKEIERNKNLILSIGGITLLVSLPLFIKGIYEGHDMMVHLMRIEGLAEEIRRGNLPVKMSSLWMDGYGYPISVFYGDLLLYIPAVLRLVGFSIVEAYKSYIFLINMGTAILSYICFKKIFEKRETALLVSLAYMTSAYRCVNIYVRAAVGEYSAMMFLPVVAAALYKIYTMEEKEYKFSGRYAFGLALGMTGLIETHILSTEMAFFTMLLICAVLWKKTFRKRVMFTYLLAVVETIALNLYFLIPFLDYYLNVDISIFNMTDDIKHIQEYGAYVGQYFSVFESMFGMSYAELAGRMSHTPGIMIFALIAAVVLWINKRATREIRLYTVFSIAALYVASNLFPWNYLGMHCKLGKIFSQVQFPGRYIAISTVFLAMLLGGIFRYLEACGRENYKKLYLMTAMAGVVMSVYYASDYCDHAVPVYYYDTAELNTYEVGGGEYVRAWSDPKAFSSEIRGEDMQEISLLGRGGTHMELYCRASGKGGKVELPVLNYKGYRIVDEYGNTYEYIDGENKVIQFTLPAEFSGKIIVDFVEPWYWKMGGLISLLAILYLCVRECSHWKNKAFVILHAPWRNEN